MQPPHAHQLDSSGLKAADVAGALCIGAERGAQLGVFTVNLSAYMGRSM